MSWWRGGHGAWDALLLIETLQACVPFCLKLVITWFFCWQVVNQFDELVEEGHGARDALLKIFTKKIKRSKKKDAGML